MFRNVNTFQNANMDTYMCKGPTRVRDLHVYVYTYIYIYRHKKNKNIKDTNYTKYELWEFDI